MNKQEFKQRLIIIRGTLLQTIRNEYAYPIVDKKGELIRNVYNHELIKNAFKNELGVEGKMNRRKECKDCQFYTDVSEGSIIYSCVTDGVCPYEVD